MFRDKNSWRVTWREAGKRRNMSFPLHEKKQAALFEAEVRSGVTTVRTKEQTCLTFAEFANKWVEDYLKVEKSESTWENDQTCIRLHINPVIGDVRLIDLRKTHGLKLKTELGKRVKAPKTRNNILGCVKKILEVAADSDIIPANPFQGVKPFKVPRPAFKFWTAAERDKFLKRAYELDPEFADVVLVATHTGLRKGELACLTRADLDFENQLICVRDTFNSRLRKNMGQTKNYEVRYAPMNQDVLRVLSTKKLMRPTQRVFRRTLLDNNRRKLKSLCNKANVQFLNIHALRHTFASCLAMAGVDLLKIQKLMGHKCISETMRYSHLHPDTIKGATDVISGDSHLTRNVPKNAHQNMVSK